jgi:hypothetical protein
MQSQNKADNFRTGDPLNCLVLKYLESRHESGCIKGRSCAGSILKWAKANGFKINSERPIRWLNYRIRDAILVSNNDHQSPWGLKEVEGFGQGINFEWWLK